MLPIVRLFFACDEATLDLGDEKWVLKNPWSTVAFPPGVAGDFLLAEMWIYAQLTDGLGEFRLSVEMRSEGGIILGRSDPHPRDFGGGYLAVEEVFHLRNVPFDRPGFYEFHLLANHAPLEGGVFTLRVLRGDEP